MTFQHFGVQEDKVLLAVQKVQGNLEEHHLIVVIKSLRGTGMSNETVARCMVTQWEDCYQQIGYISRKC